MNSDSAINRKRGFTLVELMIAMTLVSMLLSMIYASFSVVVKSWDGIDRISNENEEIRVLQTFLQQKLSMARSVINHQHDSSGWMFSGKSESLRFTAKAPAHLGDSEGLYIYKLQAVSNSTGAELQIFYDRLQPDSGLNLQAEKGINLLRTAASINFSYFGQAAGKGEAKWQSEWVSSLKLPMMVRIRVTRESKYPAWPDIIIPIKAGNSL